MATTFRITVFADDSGELDEAVNAAFQRIAELNHIFSDYEPRSEISQLSRTCNRPTQVSPDLWRILVRAREIAETTNGAFDFTCGHLSHLWRRAIRRKQLPPSERLEEAVELTDWKRVEFDEASRSITLRTPKTLLDLGGIAKGYAADAALRILRERSFPQAQVTAGGDVACGAPPPRDSGWSVGLRVTESSTDLQRIRVANMGVSTSGDLHQHVELAGRRYSHIVSPFTGMGLTQQSACTVVAPDATSSDALATAFCVAGETEWQSWLTRLPGVDARLFASGPHSAPRVSANFPEIVSQ
jgi:thiamine biosynthesis lipoprotein